MGESPSGEVDARSPLHVMPITSATIMIFTRMFLLLNNIMTIRAVNRKKARRRITAAGPWRLLQWGKLALPPAIPNCILPFRGGLPIGQGTIQE